MKKTIASVLSIVSSVVFLGNVALAQQQVSIKIEPAVIDENVDPGQVLPETLHVTNQDSQAKTFYLVAKDISGTNDNGQPIFADQPDEVYGITSWITFGVPSIVVPGGSEKDVTFSVKVPKGASPGGHFGAVFLSLDAKKPANTGTGVGLQIGPIIDLRVSGNIIEDAQIREFSTDKSVYGAPTVNFTTRIENLGNVLIKPHGLLEIVNMFGKKVYSTTINDSAAGIYPKDIRSFPTAWTSDGIAFGRYQATESWLYGQNGNQTIYQTVSFWVFPLNIILPILLGLIILILGFYFGVRTYIRSQLRAMQGGRSSVSASAAAARPAPSRLLFLTLGFIVFTLLLLVVLFFLFS